MFCDVTPPLISARTLMPSAPLAMRKRDKRCITHGLAGSASSMAMGKLECAVNRATPAGVASAIRIRSGPIIRCTTFFSNHDLPCVDGADNMI